MKGKFIYCAIASLFGVLYAFNHLFPVLLFSIIYFLLLKRYKRVRAMQLVVMITIFFLSLLVGQRAVIKNKTVIPESSSFFNLEYIQEPKIDGDLLQVLAVDTRYKEKILVRYKIKTEQEKEALKTKSFYPYSCMVSGTMNRPSIAKNPNAFNYRNYLVGKGIYWIVEVQENPLRSCTTKKPSPLVMLKQLRFFGVQYLEHHFPPEIASLSAALIFGDKSKLDPSLLDNYQQTGIVHLLAISGLHVSLFIGMILYLGIRMGLTRQFMMNFILILLPLYVILTGGAPSVMRAALMIFLILLSIKTKKHLKLLPIDTISFSFMIFLLINPMIIYDVGFQLSFSVSLVIILSAPFILQKYKRSASRLLATSMTAQLAALPLLLYHYFQLSFLGVAANMLYIPLFSFIYLPGVYGLFILQLLFRKTPDFLIVVFLKIIDLANFLIQQLATISFANFVPGRPNGFQLLVYTLVIVGLFFIWEAKSYLNRTLHLILLSCTLITLQPIWNSLNPSIEVTMIDVGQGDSIFIHLPFGKGNYLIDTGGTMSYSKERWRERAKPFEIGRDVVVPYLKGKGITTIDKLILTHGDMDHIGGTFSILKEFEVKQILMPSVLDPSEMEQAIAEEAKKAGVPIQKVSSGEHWNSEVGDFTILSPEKNFVGERNRGSIALFAKIGGINWFFGGDLNQEGEEAIIKKYPQLKVDVLKVGHHGSKTSSSAAFLKQIKPNVALISAGEKNRFGHPHQEVLNLLNKNQIIIYRTDLQGAITYRFYRGKGTFLPYLP